MKKLLTIIVPAYNAAAYLDKGLPSLILENRELFESLEVLVINDGSKDNTHEVAQKYVDQYPEVFRIIDKPNGGHGSGINVGSKQATGVYFKVLDADDWMDPTGFPAYVRKIKKLVEAAESGSDKLPDAIVTPYSTYDISKNKVEKYISVPKQYDKNYTLNEVMDQWQTIHKDMHFWGVTYNTKFYQDLHYDLEEGVFYEDQEYASIPLSFAKSVRYINEMVYIYRIGDVNQSVYGDTQVKRRSHLERVLIKMLEQEHNQDKMPSGGDRYWRKKVAMNFTSYYQIMLLKNKDKKMGRKAVEAINKMLVRTSPEIYAMVASKCKGFVMFSYLHISNDMYDTWAPKILGIVRKFKGYKV